MKMRFSRLSGRQLASTAFSLPGLAADRPPVEWTGEVGKEPDVLIGLSVERHDFRWQPADSTKPSDDLLRALETNARAAGFLDPTAWPSWDVVAQANAVLPDLGEFRENRLDKALHEHLGRLEQVLHHPHERLDSEPERVAVCRARGISARAYADLAGRPADWNWRTVDRVEPKRVLGSVLSLSLDTYENRVAVTLLRHLIIAVEARLLVIRRLLAAVDWKRNQRTIEIAGHRLRGRVARRWSSAWELITKEDIQSIQELANNLAQYRRRLLALRATPVARLLLRGAVIAGAPRSTNVLRDDPHYRAVMQLWMAWQGQRFRPAEPDDELLERDRRRLLAMEAFACTLLVQSLVELGFAPADGTLELCRGHVLELAATGRTPLELVWGYDGTVSLRRAGSRPLVLVPAVCLLPKMTPNELEEVLDAYRSADKTPNPAVRVLVYLDDWTVDLDEHLAYDRERFSDAADLAPLAPEASTDAPDCRATLPVSPLAPLSGERMARLVRRWLLPTEWREAGEPLAKYGSADGALVANQEATADCRRLQRRLRELDEEISEAETRETEAKQRSRNPTSARTQKATLKLSHSEATAQLHQRLDDGQAAQAAIVAMKCAQICPVCGKDAHASALDVGWRAECSSCSARWGMLRQADGTVAPFIEPPADRDERPASDFAAFERYGRDWMASEASPAVVSPAEPR